MSQNPTQKMAAAPTDNSKHAPLQSGLYLVATPIGNMRDISFRALDVLSGVDVIACEDTRISGKLLNAYRIKKPMLSYNDHNAGKQRGRILQALEEGQSVALISDAGTPLISDPGYKLVKEARTAGYNVTSVPGANAVLTALQLSALPSDAFCFIGFLPPKTAARKKFLQSWADVPATLIAYETAPRLSESLADMKAVLGNRAACVAREMTKMFEEASHGTLDELIKRYRKSGAPKGEIAVVIGSAATIPVTQEIKNKQAQTIEEQLRDALEKMSVKDAAEMVAEVTGKPKKTIYTLALKLAGKT